MTRPTPSGGFWNRWFRLRAGSTAARAGAGSCRWRSTPVPGGAPSVTSRDGMAHGGGHMPCSGVGRSWVSETGSSPRCGSRRLTWTGCGGRCQWTPRPLGRTSTPQVPDETESMVWLENQSTTHWAGPGPGGASRPMSRWTGTAAPWRHRAPRPAGYPGPPRRPWRPRTRSDTVVADRA